MMSDKIKVAIINPDEQTIEFRTIYNSFEGLKSIMKTAMSWKRLTIDELAEAIDNDDFNVEICCNASFLNGKLHGINILLDDSGLIKKSKKFQLGKHDYTICAGTAIISGADRDWEDLDFPYSFEFLGENITWL